MQRIIRRVIGVLCLLLATPLWAQVFDYQVRFNRSLTESETRVCFSDSIPRMLITGDIAAAPLLAEVQVRGGTVRRKANRLYLFPDSDQLCLTLVQRVKAQSSSYDWRRQRRGSMWFGRDLVLPIGSWLWRPAKLTPGQQIQLSFDLPAGVNISAPWPVMAANTFRIDHQMPYNWAGRMALGRFTPIELKVGEQTLEVAMLDGLERRRNLLDWLQQAATTVAGVSGYFPTARTQVLVLPVGVDKEAVPWAEIQRQGRPAVHFFIDQHRPIYEFTRDWTAVHEFSHLLHPYILRQDAWLFEGIASYYQNISRVRSGLLTEQQAWQKLYDGFQRGSKKIGGAVLRDSNEIMQFYWGGAAFVLMADVELHQRSGQSLAGVLHRFRQCCGEDMGPWSAKVMLRQLDQLSQGTTFIQLYRQQVSRRAFPAVYGVLDQLGVKVRNGRVSLDNAAPLAGIRREITR